MIIQVKLERIIRKRYRHRMLLDGGSITLRPKLALIEHADEISANMLAGELTHLLVGLYEGDFPQCRRVGPEDS
jgi:hypothetical protein